MLTNELNRNVSTHVSPLQKNEMKKPSMNLL